MEKSTSTTPVTKTHTVREGDTLEKVAIEYEMSMQELLEVNDRMTHKNAYSCGTNIECYSAKTNGFYQISRNTGFDNCRKKAISNTIR